MNLIPECYKEFLAKPDETLFDHTKSVLERLKRFKCYLDDDEFELLKYCCIYHDIGKLNPIFQERVRSGDRLKFDEAKEIGHNILSFLFVFNNIENISINKEYINIFFNIILNHHHYVNNFYVLDSQEQLERVNYRNTFGTSVYLKPSSRKKKSIQDVSSKPTIRQAVLKGIFHKCDYAASAHSAVDIDNDGLLERLDAKCYKWNDMQEFARNNSDSNIIIVGSTGLGKTEASLLWQGKGKGFYVLPLRTAINAMYNRIVKDFYANDYLQQVGLLHSETKNIYLKDKYIEDIDSFWEYFELTRNRALPLTICTPDQIFRFVFRYPGYETDLATFSYSRIIIDEIQAYSPDLLAVLIFGLQTINKAGGKFAITTATFPPIIREWLYIEKNECGNEVQSDISIIEKQFLSEDIRHKVKLIDDFLDADEIIDFYIKNDMLKSLKVLVVVNTVTSAQKLYLQISEVLGHENVKLIHSKFIAKDRKKLEEEIISDGKFENHKRIIWIATQVVEASLDLDFDFLFSELSELSGLFQRMGRCNRKGLKDINKPNVYVYEKIEKGLLCRTKSGVRNRKNGFIYHSLYELSKAALNEWKVVNASCEMSEADKVSMINKFYTKEKINEFEKTSEGSYASYISDYNERYKRLTCISTLDIQNSEIQDQFRNIVSINAIPSTIYSDRIDTLKLIEREITVKRDEIKKSNDQTEKERLKAQILGLKDKIGDFTLAVEPYKVDLTKHILDKWEKVYVTINDYVYDSQIGFYRSDKKAFDESSLLII